jgi:hypothetical protein
MDARARQIRPQLLLTLALSASAGLHAGLVPAHATEGTAVAAGFAASAAALAATALLVDRARRPAAYAAAAALLTTLLVLYAASRIAVVWPLDHAEPVDALGAVTKLLEAVGLVLALRLLRIHAGSARELPARQQGAGP